jgi:hypothetical protein
MDPDLLEELCSRLVAASSAVFGDDLRGVILKGSAAHGGFVPGYSDVDVHLFLRDERLAAARVPREADAFAFQEAIGGIRPAAVSELQVYFLPWEAGYPDDWVKPWPGTYRLIQGGLPDGFTDVTAEQYLSRAEQHLALFLAWTDDMLRFLATAGDDALPGLVRRLGAILKPMVYVIGTLTTREPERIWKLPLEAALDVVSDYLPCGSFGAFFAETRDWPPGPARARHMLRLGYAAIAEVRRWRGAHTTPAQRSWSW